MTIFLMALMVAAAFTLGTLVTHFGHGGGITEIVDKYLPAGATLLAAYVGAKWAFNLNLDREAERLATVQLEAGNRAIITVQHQMNRILNLQQQVVDPVRNDAARHLRMRPIAIHLPMPEIDLNSLSFLIEGDPNLVSRLSVAQDGAVSAVAMIAERSRVYIEDVQPRLEAAGARQGGDYLHSDLETMMGPRVMAILKQGTDAAIDLVDTAEHDLRVVAEELSQALKGIFPKQIVLRLAPREAVTPGSSPQTIHDQNR